jgi:hypothetical protein
VLPVFRGQPANYLEIGTDDRKQRILWCACAIDPAAKKFQKFEITDCDFELVTNPAGIWVATWGTTAECSCGLSFSS